MHLINTVTLNEYFLLLRLIVYFSFITDEICCQQDILETAFFFDRFNPDCLSKDNHFKWELLAAIAEKASTVLFNYPGFCLKYPEIQTAADFTLLKRNLANDTLVEGQHNIYTIKLIIHNSYYEIFIFCPPLIK